MTTVLTVRGARKSFADTTALDGLDLELRAGEWLGLLGPNGAGKTTTVRAIAGRVRLDEGSVELLGKELRPGDGAGRERLGIVPQDIALYEELTARENLRAFGRLHGVTGKNLTAQVDEALDWTRLADRADQRLGGFSGGMKRRLNIACAVLHQPEVLLLDEPTVGVDPQSRERIWEMLGELQARGSSLLLTTHQLDEAQQVCDRIAIVDHGRVVDQGTLEELVERTVGRRGRLSLRLDEALGADAEILAPAAGRELAADGAWLRGWVDDLVRDLPEILRGVEAAGRRVEDLRVEPPTLQAVFLHLTGRELRE